MKNVELVQRNGNSDTKNKWLSRKVFLMLKSFNRKGASIRMLINWFDCQNLFCSALRSQEPDLGFETKQVVYGPNGFGPKEIKVKPKGANTRKKKLRSEERGFRRGNLERPDHLGS
jgi:hypothetical protein